MRLLSRVFKRPVVQGTYYYQASGQPAVAANTGEPGRCSQDPPGGTASEPENSLPPAEAVENEPVMNIAPAEEQIEQRAREGYLKGKAEAVGQYREMLEKASHKLSQMEREAKTCLKQARQKAREIVSASENNIVELSVAIAEKLIKSQLEIAPHKISQIVRESINSLPEQEQVEVYVHPEDLPACLSELEQPGRDGYQQVKEFLPDDQLSRGSCRIESGSSTVEYLLGEELEKIRETLLEIASPEEMPESQEEETAYDRH